jgi:nucleoside-diphosphate-sugar epimerase
VHSLNRVLVTGATGFVGRSLCNVLVESGYSVRAAVRGRDAAAPAGTEPVPVGDIGIDTDWAPVVAGVDLVIHAAARAHVLHDAAANSELYRQTNTAGTTSLASAAATAGVRRFVFLSSIKVNGEETDGRAYRADDEPHPSDPYGVSKWLAEQSLRDIAGRTRLEVVIVRPPLVYGPGVRANFLRLMRWVDKGVPLPLGSIDNRRSLVSIWNLCDLLANLLQNPAACGTWMVSDPEDFSTPELIRRIGVAMKRRTRLLPVPVAVLSCLGSLTGRRDEVRRLCGSLVADVSQTRSVLGWSPPMSVAEGLSRTASWYLSQR